MIFGPFAGKHSPTQTMLPSILSAVQPELNRNTPVKDSGAFEKVPAGAFSPDCDKRHCRSVDWQPLRSACRTQGFPGADKGSTKKRRTPD
jgi:hypothetical protein